MIIDEIALYTNGSKFLSLKTELASPRDNYILKAAVGLDADELVSKFLGFSTYGDSFREVVIPNREVILRIGLNPNPALDESYSSLRDAIYKAISSSRTGLIDLRARYQGSTVGQIECTAVKLEAPLVTETPEVQITLNAEDGMFQARSFTSVDVSSLDRFNLTVTDNVSTSPHGFHMVLTFTDETEFIEIRDDEFFNEWSFRIEPGVLEMQEGFQEDDVLTISTIKNNRFVTLQRGFNVYSLVAQIQAGSIWPILFPGENNFYIETEFSNPFVYTSLDHTHTFWGI